MGMSADLIRGPVGMLIGLVVWLIVFPMLLGGINGWYLQAQEAGVVSGERFDRVVLKGDHENPEDAWQAVTGLETNPTFNYGSTGLDNARDPADHGPTENKGLKLVDDSGCKVYTTNTVSTNNHFIKAATAYTPLGSEVSIPQLANGTETGSASRREAKISGCTWEEAGEVFNSGGLSPLVEIILQAAGLAPPIALLFALGTFGTSFMRNVGSHPILAAVLTAIAFLLLATLLNTFIPFVSDAFAAIDKNRFEMYNQGLGNVATVVGNFYGVVIVASIMSVAWQILQSLRGRNTLSAQGAM